MKKNFPKTAIAYQMMCEGTESIKDYSCPCPKEDLYSVYVDGMIYAGKDGSVNFRTMRGVKASLLSSFGILHYGKYRELPKEEFEEYKKEAFEMFLNTRCEIKKY